MHTCPRLSPAHTCQHPSSRPCAMATPEPTVQWTATFTQMAPPHTQQRSAILSRRAAAAPPNDLAWAGRRGQDAQGQAVAQCMLAQRPQGMPARQRASSLSYMRRRPSQVGQRHFPIRSAFCAVICIAQGGQRRLSPPPNPARAHACPMGRRHPASQHRTGRGRALAQTWRHVA